MNKHTFEPSDAHEPLRGATKEFHTHFLARMLPLTVIAGRLEDNYERLKALIRPHLRAPREGDTATEVTARSFLQSAYMPLEDQLNQYLNHLHVFKPSFVKLGYQFVFSRAHEFSEFEYRPELGRAIVPHIPAENRPEVMNALEKLEKDIYDFKKQTADFCRGASADANKFGYRGR